LVKFAQPFDDPNAGSRPRRLSAIASRHLRHLTVVPTGIANTFLTDAPDGCVLVDAGLPGHDVGPDHARRMVDLLIDGLRYGAVAP
jgi:hypothetical protein